MFLCFCVCLCWFSLEFYVRAHTFEVAHQHVVGKILLDAWVAFVVSNETCKDIKLMQHPVLLFQIRRSVFTHELNRSPERYKLGFLFFQKFALLVNVVVPNDAL